jgi:hypothetical protein
MFAPAQNGDLAVEPAAELGGGGNLRRQDLDGDHAPVAQVLGALASGHAPWPTAYRIV